MQFARVHAVRLDYKAEVALHFYIPNSDGSVDVLSDFVMHHYPPGEIPNEDRAICLTFDAAQEMIDALWRVGMRPTDGAGTAGAMRATENHLKDLQSLNARLLAMIEKSK